MFGAGSFPDGLAEEIGRCYHQLGGPPVAVRSSATAEDLPEMSFAGQQDTFLQIIGIDSLLKAVVDCWSSLWTARAIGYRARNHVPQEGAALAVVVQRMVESASSGVMFTANPLTGLRSETVIDAAFGLGEALVSGLVEPDHYVVDLRQRRISEKTLGEKAVSIHPRESGGTVRSDEARKDRQALSDEQILDLARLGQQVSRLYDSPQDIEWALAGGKLYLLQSRGVTSLFPLPEGMPPEPLKVMVSFGAVQGLLDPITPLGRDCLQSVFATAAGLFHIPVNSQTQTVLLTAGERLWINITTLLRNTVGRKVIHYALGMVEPTVRQALDTILEDPRLQPERQGIHLPARFQLAGFFLPLARNIFLNLLSPRKRRQMIVANGERLLVETRRRFSTLSGNPRQRLLQIVEIFQDTGGRNLVRTFVLFVSAVASGIASFNFVRILSKGVEGETGGSGWSDLILELTRGLPHNPTTQMDLDLWELARGIKKDPRLVQEFSQTDAHELAACYQSGTLSEPGRVLIDHFLDQYGARGLGEVDMGRPRWVEDPTHVFEVLSSYLLIEEERAPDIVFARGEAAAQAALDRLVAGLRRTRGGWRKARQVRFFAGRMRELMGARENPKFFAVRLFGLVRAALLQAGADLARSGDLQQADDLVFLSFSEIRDFATGDPRDWRQLIAARREANQRESMRRQLPRLLLSDGRAFYEGMISEGDSETMLSGSPVSPGSVEGSVRVVFNPREANLLPGEIMVCPGTDPSWTPLFLTAGGLVMEVGGMMTHGAVVAREYGIPAIVGVDQATRRLQTGERIRMDGSTGRIQRVEG
jgi:pyruvate,water dikinase